MVNGVTLFEQACNDLTAAVARAKQACRLKKGTPSKNVSHIKKQRGRPKGSKDSAPRKQKTKTHKLSVHPGTSVCPPLASSYTDPTAFELLDHSLSHQVDVYFESDCAVLEMQEVADSVTELIPDPPCWELLIPC